MKKLVSLILALLLLSVCGLAEVPQYINTASDMPVIVDGEMKTYSVVVPASDEFGYSDEVWFWKFCEEALNIKFEVENSYDLQTRMSLAFASKELPDAFLGCHLTTGDLVNYGVNQQQLVDLKPYITPELMPYLSARVESDPSLLTSVTAPDGKLYSLPRISSIAVDSPANRAANSGMRWYINQNWLDELGLEDPQTLDEFIDVLREFKTLGDDIVPMGGSATSQHPGKYILNALGYITTDSWGVAPALRHGEVVIPAGDREAFGEYLTVMNQMWEEGLIEKDFFTLDNTTTDGKMSLNQYGVYGQVAYLYLPDTFQEWDAVAPLTSDFNETKGWPVGGELSADGTMINAPDVGGFVVTTACKDIEGLMRFADLFYAPNSYYVNLEIYGPSAKMVEELGMGYGVTKGWEMDPETRTFKYVEKESSSDNYPYQCDKIFGIHAGAIWGDASFVPTGMQVIEGLETDASAIGVTLDPNNGDDHYRILNIEKYYDHLTNQYPSITFFDADTQLKISDLTVIITDWVKQETAKFVTGLRPLDEIDAYFDELDALGFQDLLEIYVDYYENMK